MQLCACCQDYDGCQLDKRRNPEFSLQPCEFFKRIEGLSLDRYVDMRRLVAEARDSNRTPGPTVELSIPFEVSPTDFLPPEVLPPQTYLAFAQTNFADEVDREQFEEAHSHVCEWMIFHTHEPLHVHHDQFLAIQGDMKTLVNAYAEDPESFASGRLCDPKAEDYPKLLNGWLARLKLQIRPYPKFQTRGEDEAYDQPREEGDLTYWRTLTPDETRNVEHWFLRPELCLQRAGQFERFAILFAQFAVDVLRGQELKKCPICDLVFVPKRRRGAAATCPKGACKTEWSRNRDKYEKSM